MADIRDLDQIIGDDPVNNAVRISCCQERPITLEGIEHGRSHLGKVAQELDLGNDLVLNRKGKGLQLILSARQELNPSWHALPFWL
jgi:hypothetical protein